MLNRLRTRALADRPEHRFALVPVRAGDAYLDQLVALEMDFDLTQHRFGQTFVPDQDHGVQRMRARLERLAREGSEFHIGHRSMLRKVRPYLRRGF